MKNKKGSIALAMMLSVLLLTVITVYVSQILKERESAVLGEQTTIKSVYKEEFLKESIENLVYQTLKVKSYQSNLEQKIIEQYEIKEIESKMNKILKERGEKQRILLTLEAENNPKIKEICSIDIGNRYCNNITTKFVIKSEVIEGAKNKRNKIAFENIKLLINQEEKVEMSMQEIRVKVSN